MEFFEALGLRRYREEPVPEADLKAILEAAPLAPSAKNAQPWRFLAVRKRARLREMEEAVNALIEQRLAECQGDEAQRRHIPTLRPFSALFSRAPAAVFVLYRPFLG